LEEKRFILLPELDLFLISILVGFFAQLVDGTLGMAYGVISNTFLLSYGLSAPVSSASIHLAEVFTTLASGLSHLRIGNVDKCLVKRLVFTGVSFGVFGAYISTVIPKELTKTFVSIYLLVMGLIILFRIIKPLRIHVKERSIPVLGSIAGFLDAVGGGGWGPITTSTLLAAGYNPRFTVGSVNFAEFFISIAVSATFFAIIGPTHLSVVAGLLLGGIVIAPFGAYLCKRIPSKLMLVSVGCLIIILSVRTLLLSIV